MSGVFIRSNLSCSDQVRYFSSQWSGHLASQAMGWLTDLRMVARDGSVEVHRAVILPLCPLLGIMDSDITQEDPTVILPGHPLELLQAFVKLIYKGSTMMSEVVTISNLLELMTSLGLNMPVNCLVVDRVREEVIEVGTVSCKKPNGLEIFEVNNSSTRFPLPHDHSARRQSLEITTSFPPNPICSSQPVQHHLSKLVLPPKGKPRGKAASITKIEMKFTEPINSGQIAENTNSNLKIREMRPVEVKLECEEFIVEDVKPSTMKKKKWNRRRETLDILLHSCEFCDFKCRFMRSLQEHCDKLHRDKQFKCFKCKFIASSFASLRDHKRKRHAGKEKLFCTVCGFGTKRKRELLWHKMNVHAAGDFQVRPDKLVKNPGEGSVEIGGEATDDLKLKEGLANDVDETMFKETESNVLNASEEILNIDIDGRSTVDVGAWDSTLEETGDTEEQAVIESVEGFSIDLEKNVNRVNVVSESKEDGVEQKATNSSESVRFKSTLNQAEENSPQILKMVKATQRQMLPMRSLPLKKMRPAEVKKARKGIVKKLNVETSTIINTNHETEDEPKAHPVQNVFKPEWLDPQNLLFDINGDRLNSYLSPVPHAPSMATCQACKMSFSISVLGVGQVYRHARLAGHKEGIRRLRYEVGWMGGVEA